MEQPLKIKLSKVALDELMEMIKLDGTCDSVRFVFDSACCKTSKVDIYLDNFKTGDIKNNIDNLQILYDNTLLDNLCELTIAYSDSRFWVKTKLTVDSKPSCPKHGTDSCGGCSGHCGSH
ncbi:hypothetical protein KPL37_08605 [Clostridium frigoris]|uniref:Fe-S cluster assembly iron-binding protein IscA n=1 Tax=Clostridium frigoris TaxID=205327 RepID=A0ABS6BTG7_9CLOT|nr:hypothetical protein [Clostridium frigoris]MBU3159810.1 hypothetical protein [Clostridium frigoris]